ncbi:MAG: hypothetical protein K1X36_07240 [Pyrinomonadaceae bacterium]|nr:hypothetical protein [Pyrinomonadaceae bacterium]
MSLIFAPTSTAVVGQHLDDHAQYFDPRNGRCSRTVDRNGSEMVPSIT